MIRFLWTFRLSPAAFLRGVPRFVIEYVQTRPWKNLLPGIPAILLTIAVGVVGLQSDAFRNSGELTSTYKEEIQKALGEGKVQTAEVYLGRILQTSTDPSKDTFEFALQMYESAGGTDMHSLLIPPLEHGSEAAAVEQAAEDRSPHVRRSLSIMQSLAPRGVATNRYFPAHDFLAKFWESRQPMTDQVVTLGLQHRMLSRPGDVGPALRLAEFIAERGYHSRAINVLHPYRETSAEVQLQLAVSYSTLEQHEDAVDVLRLATERLSAQLAASPEDMALRERLSRAQAALGEPLQSMLTLANGCDGAPSPQLADQLIQRYVWWLSTMNDTQISSQLAEIRLALEHSQAIEADVPVENTILTTSAGQEVSLPGPVTAFHTALLNGDGKWMIPLLLGTAAASSGDFDLALARLNESERAAPGHPIVANNLAWTQHRVFLLDQRDSVSDSPDREPDQIQEETRLSLEQAWKNACLAVDAHPENASFRATRGLIASSTFRWDQALEDLELSVKGGVISAEVTAALKLARTKLLSGAP